MTQPASPIADRRSGWLLVSLSAVVTAAIVFICCNRSIPLGVPGEWVWNRLPRQPIFGLIPVVASGLLFIALSVAGRRMIERRPRRAAMGVILTMAAAIPLHWSIFFMPASPMGPERWLLSLSNSASSGYFSVAWNRRPTPPPNMIYQDTTAEFLRNYEAWITEQDSFHIGTHPPGLFLTYRWIIDSFVSRRSLADGFWRYSPARLTDAGAELRSSTKMWRSGYSVIVAVSLLTWLAFWLSCPLVYLLSRLIASPTASYSSASIWLLAPGPLLFMPLADVAYVFVSSMLGALLIAGARNQLHSIFPILFGMAAGFVFVVGINLSLAFTVVLLFALVAGLFLEPRSFVQLHWWLAWASFTATVATIVFLFRFGLEYNLPAVLSINLQKHRGFYEAFHRTYWTWIGVNLIEFAAMLGVMVVSLLATCREKGRRRSTACAFLATLLLLDLTGKNLSEVGRLWLFLTPLAAAASAPVFEGEKLSSRGFAILLILQAISAVFLYSSVEPLLPVGAPP